MRQSLGWVSNFRRAKYCARDPGLPGGDFFSIRQRATRRIVTV
jgi:hypothetical protein